MSLLTWNQHFFASTRGRIVLLLRRSDHTVDELAQQLGLTDNAVRAHLATLERDGLVYQSGTRRGSGKPALVYDLTPEAERLFPKAYAPVLQQLLATLSASLPGEKLEEVIQQTGRRLAAQWNIAPGELRARLQGALAVLNELGGLAELEEDEDSYIIQSYSCPLAAVAPNHPAACQLVRALLTELLGEPVTTQCGQSGPAHCRFATLKYHA